MINQIADQTFHVLFYASAKITKQFQVQLTCDGELSFYDRHIGKLVVSNNAVKTSSNYILDPGTQILAVRCRNHLSKPWIMGSVSNGLVTDKRWKCLGLPREEMMTSDIWASPDFDDSHWPHAVANFSNRETSPWGKVPGIRDEAFWISTADGDMRLFCRRRLSEVSVKQSKSSGMY